MMVKKHTFDYIQKTGLDIYGFILLSGEYVNNRSPLLWRDSKTGAEFTRSWSDIGKGCVNVKNRNSYSSDKYDIETYASLGYKLDMTEEEYRNAPRAASGNRLFKIKHPYLPNVWETTITHFKEAAVSHFNNMAYSNGEFIISSILANNCVDFKKEYQVKIGDETHRFDFYIPSKNLYIEYDGMQHYKQVPSWGGERALKERQIRDKEKQNFVKTMGGTMLRISYKISSPEKIFEKLSKETDLDLNIFSIDIPLNIKQVADYYYNHTVKETEKRFGLSGATIQKYFKLSYGKPKREARVDIYSAVSYYDTHTVKETLDKYPMSRSRLMTNYVKIKGNPKGNKVHAK